MAVRSVKDLLVRPGRLTRAYVDGQRARYVPPVTLYLWFTAGFFLFHAYSPFVRLNPETGMVDSGLSAVVVGTALSQATLLRLSESGMTLAEFAPRFDAAAGAYLPVLLVLLVAATALLMALLFWRETVVTHLVFALHWSAFYFGLEVARQALKNLGSWGTLVSAFGLLVALGYLVVAMKRVYRRGWLGSLWRASVSIGIFSLLLAGWLWSTTIVAAGISSWLAL